MNSIYIIILIIIIIYIITSIRENYDNEIYGSKEALNGCDIYGCNIEGKLKLNTYEPIIEQSSQYNDKCFTKNEVNVGNYYPEKNNLAPNYNTSAIVINTGLAVIKENVKEAIDVINKKKLNMPIEELVLNIINTINTLSDSYHKFSYKFIDKNSYLKKDKYRIEFDIIGRYEFKSDFLKIDNNLVNSLKNLVIHINLSMNNNVAYINDMYLLDIYNILPNN